MTKKVTITKTDWYYILEDEQRNYLIEPFPKKLKIITLIIVKELPRDIKEQILDKLIIGTIIDEYMYEKIGKEFEKEEIMLYCKEKIQELSLINS